MPDPTRTGANALPSRKKDEPTAAERIAAIEGRQQHLLAELDRLNELVEGALADFAPRAEGAAG